jgi:hypothetical protein
LLRSGISIHANVEEAQAGQSRPDFLSKYSIALKKARGVKPRPVLDWLLLADWRERRALNSHGTELSKHSPESNHAQCWSGFDALTSLGYLSVVSLAARRSRLSASGVAK